MKGFILVILILLFVGFSKSYHAQQQRKFIAETSRQYELGRFDNTIMESKKIIREYGHR